MEDKKAEAEFVASMKMPRWMIDWNANDYPWIKTLKNMMAAMVKTPGGSIKNEFPLDVFGTVHYVKIVLTREDYPRHYYSDEFHICFRNKYKKPDPRSACCFQYSYHPVMKYSVIHNILYRVREDKDFTAEDCPKMSDVPYGDYVIRLCDQMNVAFGVDFCTLINAFYNNVSHILRFRSTYYNKFGYFGHAEYIHDNIKYDSENLLKHVDEYNRLLVSWVAPDFIFPKEREHANMLITTQQDIGHQFHIKPYGDNLVRFIPSMYTNPDGSRVDASTISESALDASRVSPARFEIYRNPHGSKNILDRLADTLGALFVTRYEPPKDVSANQQICPECGTDNPMDATACEFCTTKFQKPADQQICPECGTANPMDATRCEFCTSYLSTR